MNRRSPRLLAIAAWACLVAGMVTYALQPAAPGPAPGQAAKDAGPQPVARPVEPKFQLLGIFAGRKAFAAEPAVDATPEPNAGLPGTLLPSPSGDSPVAVPALPANAQFVEGMKDVGPFDPPIDRAMFADKPRGLAGSGAPGGAGAGVDR